MSRGKPERIDRETAIARTECDPEWNCMRVLVLWDRADGACLWVAHETSLKRMRQYGEHWENVFVHWMRSLESIEPGLTKHFTQRGTNAHPTNQ